MSWTWLWFVIPAMFWGGIICHVIRLRTDSAYAAEEARWEKDHPEVRSGDW